MQQHLQHLPRLLLWCAMVAVGSVHAAEGVREYRSPVRPAYEPNVAAARDVAGRPLSGPVRVAILGAVAQPATYICPRGTELGTLLRSVGGLTQEASGSLVIFRRGRLQGSYAINPASPEFGPIGPLDDGDVVVFQSERGVRRAHYQWSIADAGALPSIQDASQERFIYVACVGLANYPVVLNLKPDDANESALLLELMGMDRAAVARGIRPLLKATSDRSETLPDGTVLLFDMRAIGPEGINPAAPFPQPLEMPQVPEVDEQPADNRIDAVRGGLTPLPTPVSQRIVKPVAEQVAADGHRLNEALPGFPFIVRDSVWSDAVDVAGRTLGGASPGDVGRPSVPSSRPVEVVRGLASDQRQGPDFRGSHAGISGSTPSGSLVATADSRTTGIRSTPAAAIAVTKGTPEAQLDGTPSSKEANRAANLSDPRIIGGIGLAVVLCLLAGWLSLRELHRRRGTSAEDELRVPTDVVPAAATASTTPLQELLENRLPLIEEQMLSDRPIQLHGTVVGQQRLRVDAAHQQIRAPHFARVASAIDTERQQRFQRHLAAVVSQPARRSANSPEIQTVGPAAVHPGHKPVRYDIVRPEPAGGASTVPPPARLASRKAGGQGDLLARVLTSLREEA